ncbi:probable serine/threonine-protein kinase clkA [Daktulosphaira vitifoliae]|uniref:probable serine/threonine-protein kinase clkA n=1 Tax=Daktulosphaira vitifoliae TaxID=58002 RepID=UPI0021A97FA5|nr:probable serine/threonine-protein kinase clkA [Daktulosphaira vitifoliae]
MSFNQRVCKFFLQGNCMYGTSCRFLHSNQTNDHYYDDYHSRNDRNTGSYYNYNSQQNRRHGNNYYNENEEYDNSNRYNYQSNNQNNCSSSRKNHGLKNDYGKNYSRNKEYNSYDEFIENQTENNNQYHISRQSFGINNSYYKDENQCSYAVANRKSNSRYKNTKCDQLQSQLKNYSSEINNYQAHMKQLLSSNIWPLSCSQPIGHSFPIQPIGILNLIEVSFEEIRCDYYFAKSLNLDALSIHKQLYEKLLLKACRQKESIIISEENVLNDMLATFEKCNTILNNPAFHNSIQVDSNSYWDMTIKYLSSAESNKIFDKENGQGFNNNNVANEPKKKINNKPQIQILMQTETYGKMDCNEFVQEEFTDFIPIMPPPKKYCP